MNSDWNLICLLITLEVVVGSSHKSCFPAILIMEQPLPNHRQLVGGIQQRFIHKQ